FIGPPFVRCRLAGADDAAYFLPGVWVGRRPGVYDKHDHMANHAHGLPAFFLGVWVAPTGCQGIAEHQLGSLEAPPVIPLVGSVLVVVPCPTQVAPPVTTGM